jgi:sugar (pentulose or hexulose) kinase
VRRVLVLGVDAGLTMTKAALFDEGGHEVAAVSTRREISHPRPGWAERSMDEAWMSAARAVRNVLTVAGANSDSVAAVGLTGAMVGVWPIDAKGRPVRQAILVSDTRGQEAIDAAVARDPKVLKRIFASDGCVVEPGCTLPALRWLFDHEPQTMASARWILTCKDWLRFRLTGEIATDETEAAVAPGDARARGRSIDILRLFSLDTSIELFPPVLVSEAVAGHVTATAASETGLRAGTPVAVGAGDVPCCALASGAADPGIACTILGTTLHNGFIVNRPMFEPLDIGLLFTLPDHLWLRVIANLAGTSNLDWALQAFFPGEEAKPSFARVEQMANTRPAGAGGIVYHPYLSEVGLIAPVVARGVHAQFSGLRSGHGRWDLMRAVYEGVAFFIRDCYSAIDRPIREIRLVGGGARSDFWCQMIADVLGATIVAPEGNEFGAKGAALLASVAIGWWKSPREAARRTDHVRRRFNPNERVRPAYEDAFARYRALRASIVAQAARG